MNLSRAISHIIMHQALFRVKLPFDDTPENIVRDVLKTITIPTYSQFEPWKKESSMDLKNKARIIDEKQCIYRLPEDLTITPIISVLDVRLPIHVPMGLYGDIGFPYQVGRGLQNVLISQAYSMTIGEARNEPTFEYLGENKIRLYGFPRTDVIVTVACEHDENGESIPPTCYDSFMQLATLDVKIFLYNNLKLYDGLPSAFGQINLKIDDLQSAEADRNALLEEWRNVFHLDMPYNFEWM